MAGFVKTKRHVLTDDGYKTISQWSNANSVEMDNGTNVQTEITNLKNTATSTANGLMSKDDKAKLDTVATSANNYTHPTYTSKTNDLYKITVDNTGHVNTATKVAKSDITALGIPAQDTTYAVATTAKNGLMSSANVTKLSTIDTSANNYTHPTYTSSASGFKKFTVDATGHVSATAAVTKADITALGIPGEDTNTTYAVATTTANGLLSKDDKIKLNGIAEGANNYTHPTYTSAASALRKVTIDATGHVSATAAVAKADITGLGIPAQDTTYAAATTAANGLMSKDDKIKLNSIAASANKYTHPTYTSAASGFYKVAISDEGHVNEVTNIVKADITDLGIPAQDTTYAAFTSAAEGLVPAAKSGSTNYATSAYVLTGAGWKAGTKYNTDTNTTYAVATTAANGLLSKDDKIKLNGIAEGANNYTHPTYTSSASGFKKFTVDDTGHVSATAAVAKSDITALGIPGEDTTYAAATTSADGLMSKDDKTKLDGIAEGANNYTHPTYTSSASGFKKFTVDATGHVSATAAVTKADITALGIPGEDTNTTYAAFTSAANGLVPAAKNGTTNYATSAYVLTGAGWKAGTKYNTDTTYASATSAANGLMSKDDKTKLDGIAEGANNYTHPTYTSAESGLYKVAVDGTGHVSGATAVTKSDITALGIPGEDTNTTYAAFTSAANGLVPAAKSGSTNYATSAYVLTGAGWKAGTKYNTDNNTTYAAVTTAADGLMIAADKTKLDGIAEGANNYTHPTYTSAASALRKVTIDTTGHVSATAAVTKSDITALGIPGEDTNTTYAAFTSAANGLVPAAKSGSTNYATSAYVLTGAGWKAGTKYNTDTTYAVATSAANGLMSSAMVTSLNNSIPSSEKGANNGVAPLNASGQIDSVYLPAYVDDVLEFESRDAFPATGESGKIYVDTSVEENNTYRWSGSTYILIAKNTNTTYSISKSGSTITLTGSDGSTSTVSDANTTYAAVTTAANGLMSKDDKIKLNSIDASANKYTHPTYTSSASGFKKFTVDGTGHVSATAAVTKADITALGIPGEDTNTTYAAFTSAANGLVPAAKSGSTNYATSAYVLTGAGWKAGTKYNTDTNTTYAAVTTAANGLMIAADKTKLDGIEDNANNYTHPTYTSAESGLYKVAVDGTGHVSGATAVAKADITELGIPAQDTTYAAFTSAANGLVPAAKNGTTSYLTSAYVLTGAGWKAGTKYNVDNNTTYAAVTTAANGLMIAADKTKLDGIEDNANNYTHPTYTSAASALRKVTVDSTGHVSATAAVTKADITALGIPGEDTNTTYAAFTSAAAGLVPAAKNGSTSYLTSAYVLTGAGWAAGTKYNTDTTYAAFTSAANGLVPAAKSGTTNYATSAYVLTGAGWAAGTKYNTDTTYAAATTAANGLMSKDDKIKLNSIAASANKYTHPTYTSSASGFKKFTVDGTGHVSATAAVAKADITALGIPAQDTTYAAVTTAADGLMTSIDKLKSDNLSGIYTVKGTQTAVTGSWLGEINVPALYDGLTIAYYLPYSGSGNATLNLTLSDGTTTGAIDCYYTGTSRLTTQYGAGSTIILTYWSAGSIKVAGTATTNDRWTHCEYNSNTTYALATTAKIGLMPILSNNSDQYLDGTGSWSTPIDTTYAAVTTAANGLMSKDDKIKLNSIAASANKYTHPTYTSSASGFKKFTVDGTGHVSATAAVAKSDITALGIPAQDTTYAAFTSSANGLVPAAKSGSTSYLTSAYVLTGAGWAAGTKYNTDTTYTHPTYTSAASALRKVTIDATGHVSATAAVAKSDITALGIPGEDTNTTYANYIGATTNAAGVAGLVPSATTAQTSSYLRGDGTWNVPTNTTYAAATTAANGLMSKDDKIKLNSIATSANKYTHPTYTSSASGFKKFTVDGTGHVSATAAVAKSDITALGIPAQDTTYAAVTTAANGLMSKDDKIKLNSIDTSANKYTHPTYTSAASGFYKVAVDGTGHVSGATAVAKADITDLGIPAQDTTYANYTSAAAGLVPAAKNGTTSYLTSAYVLTGAGWKAGTKYNTDTNTTYAAVTTAANGLMIAADKTKLDGIEDNANNYTHPTYTSSASGFKKFTVDDTGHVSATAAVAKADITDLGIPAQDTTYAAFTSAAAGLVPAAKSGSTSYLTSAYVLTGAGWKAGTKYNTDTTYAAFTSAANGLVPAAKNGTTSYLTSAYVLTGAGWKAGTKYNTDTTYASATSAAVGLTKASYVDGTTLVVF